MLRASAPGKLMLSGEWSVLEVGNPAIVMAVDKGVKATIDSAKRITLDFPDIGVSGLKASYDGELRFDSAVPEMEMAIPKAAIEMALRYIESRKMKLKPFILITNSESSWVKTKDGRTEKLGFGSSAAVTVVIIAAILKHHGLDANKETIYKLSALSHYFAQGKVGSGFDIAASTYGGVFAYTRFDPAWLTENYGKLTLSELIEKPWPSFSLKPLKLPKDFILSVGFSGRSASTKELVKKVEELKKKDADAYNGIISGMASVTKKMIGNFSDKSALLDLIQENRSLLKELGLASGVEIETPELAKLAEIAMDNGSAGKLSGAGGGDCGIAVSFDPVSAERIKTGWLSSGIYPIEVKISGKGVTVE